MRRRLLRGLSFLAASLLLFPVSRADAGWIIEQVDADFPGAETVYFVDGDRVRIVGLIPDLVILLDLSVGDGYILDESRGKYAGGGLAKIEAAMHKRKRGNVKKNSEDVSVNEQGGPKVVLPDMRIERVPETDMVAGFESSRYRIFLSEELVEEIWIAPDVTALVEGGISKLFSALEIMDGGTSRETWDFPPGYDEHPDYLELLNSGFPVRRTLFFIGEGSTEEVRSAREEPLPDSLFSIPEGMKKVGYKGYLNLFMGMD